MGISGLLPLLKSVTRKRHVREYAGKKVAIDTFCWLHRGAIACSLELCQGLPTMKHVEYCMTRVEMLLSHGVQPVMVFDGGLLPSKASQESKRGASRKENRERAEALLQAGNVAGARESFQKAVDITPEIAHQLIKVLRARGIEYIVAPYEADAQMALLAVEGLVHAVITEDSDLIAHACPRVLFKMDKWGQGEEVEYSNLPDSMDLCLTDFSPRMILEMCVLSGCDYLPSLPKVGLKKAHALLLRCKSYKRALQALRLNGVSVPDDYEPAFENALCTFLHHRVFHPQAEVLQHLHPLPPHLAAGPAEALSFLGPELPPTLARAIARGEVNPITHQPFEVDPVPRSIHMGVANVDRRQQKGVTIFGGGNGQRGVQQNAASKNLPLQKNKVSKYFVAASPAAKKAFQAPRPSPDLQPLSPPHRHQQQPLSPAHCKGVPFSPTQRNTASTARKGGDGGNGAVVGLCKQQAERRILQDNGGKEAPRRDGDTVRETVAGSREDGEAQGRQHRETGGEGEEQDGTDALLLGVSQRGERGGGPCSDKQAIRGDGRAGNGQSGGKGRVRRGSSAVEQDRPMGGSELEDYLSRMWPDGRDTAGTRAMEAQRKKGQQEYTRPADIFGLRDRDSQGDLSDDAVFSPPWEPEGADVALIQRGEGDAEVKKSASRDGHRDTLNPFASNGRGLLRNHSSNWLANSGRRDSSAGRAISSRSGVSLVDPPRRESKGVRNGDERVNDVCSFDAFAWAPGQRADPFRSPPPAARRDASKGSGDYLWGGDAGIDSGSDLGIPLEVSVSRGLTKRRSGEPEVLGETGRAGKRAGEIGLSPFLVQKHKGAEVPFPVAAEDSSPLFPLAGGGSVGLLSPLFAGDCDSLPPPDLSPMMLPRKGWDGAEAGDDRAAAGFRRLRESDGEWLEQKGEERGSVLEGSFTLGGKSGSRGRSSSMLAHALGRRGILTADIDGDNDASGALAGGSRLSSRQPDLLSPLFPPACRHEAYGITPDTSPNPLSPDTALLAAAAHTAAPGVIRSTLGLASRRHAGVAVECDLLGSQEEEFLRLKSPPLCTSDTGASARAGGIEMDAPDGLAPGSGSRAGLFGGESEGVGRAANGGERVSLGEVDGREVLAPGKARTQARAVNTVGGGTLRGSEQGTEWGDLERLFESSPAVGFRSNSAEVDAVRQGLRREGPRDESSTGTRGRGGKNAASGVGWGERGERRRRQREPLPCGSLCAGEQRDGMGGRRDCNWEEGGSADGDDAGGPHARSREVSEPTGSRKCRSHGACVGRALSDDSAGEGEDGLERLLCGRRAQKEGHSQDEPTMTVSGLPLSGKQQQALSFMSFAHGRREAEGGAFVRVAKVTRSTTCTSVASGPGGRSVKKMVVQRQTSLLIHRRAPTEAVAHAKPTPGVTVDGGDGDEDGHKEALMVPAISHGASHAPSLTPHHPPYPQELSHGQPSSSPHSSPTATAAEPPPPSSHLPASATAARANGPQGTPSRELPQDTPSSRTAVHDGNKATIADALSLHQEPSATQPPSAPAPSPSLSPARNTASGNHREGAAPRGEREERVAGVAAVELGAAPCVDGGVERRDGRRGQSESEAQGSDESLMETAGGGGGAAVCGAGLAESGGAGMVSGSAAGEPDGLHASDATGQREALKPATENGGIRPDSRTGGGNHEDPFTTPIADNQLPYLSGCNEGVEPSQVFASPPCRQHGAPHAEMNGKGGGDVFVRGERRGFEGRSSYFEKKKVPAWPASPGVQRGSQISRVTSKSVLSGESDECEETDYDGNCNNDSKREAQVSGGYDEGGEEGREGEGEEGEGGEGDAELPPSCTGASGMATDVSHVPEFGRIGHRAVSQFVARMREGDDLSASSARDSPVSPRPFSTSPLPPVGRGPIGRSSDSRLSTPKAALAQGGGWVAGAKRAKPQRGGGTKSAKSAKKNVATLRTSLRDTSLDAYLSPVQQRPPNIDELEALFNDNGCGESSVDIPTW